MPKKAQAPVAVADPTPPPEPVDPWSCAACCAPSLRAAFRIKGQSFCWDCFFERPGRETATFVVHPKGQA